VSCAHSPPPLPLLPLLLLPLLLPLLLLPPLLLLLLSPSSWPTFARPSLWLLLPLASSSSRCFNESLAAPV
jgi:hypothetical protein